MISTSFFIPESLKQDRSVFRSARLIIRIDMVILLLSAIFVPVFYIWTCPPLLYTLLFSLTCALVFPFVLYFSENLSLAGDFFTTASIAVFFGLSISTGGINSPFIIWFLTIPPIGFFYLKKKKARFWTGLTLVTVFLLMILTIVDANMVTQLDKKWMPFIVAFNFSLVLWLFSSVVISFNTGYRRMNQRLTSSNKKLLESNEELERFAYIASHDLKSPLRNVISFTQLFKRHYQGRLDKVGAEYIEFISSGSRQMYKLIEDILEYSKSGNQERHVESVDLNEVVYLIAQQIKNGGTYGNCNIKYDTLPTIKADLTLMQQLFQNLIENGLKYNINDNRIVEISYIQKGESYQFTIRDNGIGIDPTHNKRIFEMFQRLHNSKAYSGTGIGLAICKKIVLECDGEIWLNSTLGKGTDFHFTLKNNHELETEKTIDLELMSA